MKKLFNVILFCVMLVVTVAILTKTSALENILAFVFEETQNSENDFKDNWYFNTLSMKEQEIYLKLATAISSYESKALEIGDSLLSANMASRAYEAYLLDNPYCFYLSSKYEINISKVFNITKLEIKLEYIDNKNIVSEKVQEFNEEVDRVVANVITPNMTDFEKEVALHDYLIKNVRYYAYTNIDEIPTIKHTAFGALIGREAVCDGISKAYSVLLNKCGIKSIVVNGKTSERHAWNKAMLDEDWYNIDVTSDACGKERVMSHIYFNLTDNELASTHVFNSAFATPECSSKKYNYYEYNDFKVTTQDFFADKIRKIINNSEDEVLEFKLGNNIDVQAVVQELYDQNFNNYKSNNIREVQYFYVQDVIVVSK